MALLFFDGMDLYGSSSDMAFQNYSAFCPILNTGGRFGAGAIQMDNYYDKIQYNLAAAATEVWCGYAMEYVTGTVNGQIMFFGTSAGTELSVWFNPRTGAVTIYRGGNNTVLGTATMPLIAGAWHWIEYHYKISTTVGVFEMWVDGVRLINLTGINTTQNSQTSFIYTGMSDSSQQSCCTVAFDDYYILDTTGSINNTRLGDSRIETLLPNSDTGPNNGTLSTGTNHYACVNAIRNNGGSTYITLTNTSGQEELFGCGALAGTPISIHGVKVGSLAEKTDAGACNLEGVISSSGTTAAGASVPLLTNYTIVPAIFEQDPHTSANWTYGAVNVLKVGFEIP